jgi:malate dehydrogenase (oxaloacetate-decarboxylating)
MGGTGPRTGYVLVLRLELSDTPGTLGRLTTAIGEAGGDIGDIDLVGQYSRKVLREVIVTCRNEAHAQELTAKAAAVEGVRVLEVGDRTFLAHEGASWRSCPSCHSSPPRTCRWLTPPGWAGCRRRSPPTPSGSGT